MSLLVIILDKATVISEAGHLSRRDKAVHEGLGVKDDDNESPNSKFLPCTSRSVCRIEAGNTNAYLAEDRAIEEFLRGVEPKYTASIAKLRNGEIDAECVGVIAGFAAYVACCAPASMRIHGKPLESSVVSVAAILDRQWLLPRAPTALSGKTLSELLADGTVHVDVDQKFPQAIGIRTILDRVALWGNSAWEVLLNDDPGNPFFTSDYPIALEARDIRTANWIVPLAPDLAVRIIPDIGLSGSKPDRTFAKFRNRHRMLARAEIVTINRLIVRSAEDLVFYRDNHAWVPNFIARNRFYRIEAVTERRLQDAGFIDISTLRIVERTYTAAD